MFERHTGFRAEEHGFRFMNRFDALPDIQLPDGRKIDLGDLIIGLCGGMCFTALDYYYQHLQVPAMDAVEGLPGDLLKALQGRQRESNSLAVLKKLFSWIMKPDGEVSRLTAWREFPKLRQKLDAGEPAVLLLVHTRGLQNPTLNHQVIATGYKFDALTRKAEISIYDPNRPGGEFSLLVNLAGAAREWDITMPGSEPLRGFFVQSYRTKQPPVGGHLTGPNQGENFS